MTGRVVAKTLGIEFSESKNRNKLPSSSEAHLFEELRRIKLVSQQALSDEQLDRFLEDGQRWRHRRHQMRLDVRIVAGVVGVTSIDLYLMECGLPPLSRPRKQVADELDLYFSL